jgi:hypothetical protein
MKDQRSEAQLQAEIREFTAKLKQIRNELRQEIRRHTTPRVVDTADERPRPARRRRRR